VGGAGVADSRFDVCALAAGGTHSRTSYSTGWCRCIQGRVELRLVLANYSCLSFGSGLIDEPVQTVLNVIIGIFYVIVRMLNIHRAVRYSRSFIILSIQNT
jgi:hypothetical protein